MISNWQVDLLEIRPALVHNVSNGQMTTSKIAFTHELSAPDDNGYIARIDGKYQGGGLDKFAKRPTYKELIAF